jgi:hypothetical protein
MIYSKYQIDQLVEMSDADGVWALLQDQGLYEDAQYVESKYFES